MKTHALAASLRSRFRSRLLLGLTGLSILLSLGGLSLGRWLATQSHQGVGPVPPWPIQGAYILWTSFSLFMLSPLGWQWTGDDRPRAPFGRGLVQCLVLVTVEAMATSIPYARHFTPTSQGMSDLGMWTIHASQWAFAGYAIATWEHHRRQKRAAQEKAREAQWTLLQSQMSPHALLNALNGLAQLVREDPEAGRKGIADLSEIYRLLMDHGDAQRVTLAQERELLARFLAVEQLRLGNRLQVQWDWDPAVDALELPPLLLQPLVENAVKHGIAPSEAGGTVSIGARREASALELWVANTGQSVCVGSTAGSGLGLRNLEARLRLAYGPRGRFHFTMEASRTVARIRIEGGAL